MPQYFLCEGKLQFGGDPIGVEGREANGVCYFLNCRHDWEINMNWRANATKKFARVFTLTVGRLNCCAGGGRLRAIHELSQLFLIPHNQGLRARRSNSIGCHGFSAEKMDGSNATSANPAPLRRRINGVDTRLAHKWSIVVTSH